MVTLVEWSKTRQPWGILFFSALSLLLAALYFQHVQNYLPCVRCIYQRTAVIGICLAALVPLLYPHVALRILALAVWIYASVEGYMAASAQIEVIYADSFLVAPCPIVPDFPEFLPLHDLLPPIFDGPGSCSDNSWQFLSLGMAEWMRIIFGMYFIVAMSVALSYIAKYKKVK